MHFSIPAWRTPLTKKPGRPQSTGSQGWTWRKWACTRRHKTFLSVAALPQSELGMKLAQLLGLWGPRWHQVCRDTDCICRRSYGPLRVFFWASRSWRSESLSGQSFSVNHPFRRLEGSPACGPSVQQAHTGPPGWGPSLQIGVSGT